ncbi:MAG: BatD family protein [Thermoguttaceae bacterium]
MGLSPSATITGQTTNVLKPTGCNPWAWAWLVIILAATALLSPAARCMAAEAKPEIIVKTDRDRIYEGESVVYSVTLNNVDNPRAPDLSGFDDFSIVPLGEQPLDFHQVIIINGKRSEITRRGRRYTYRLTPKKSGELIIPAPTADLDGQRLRGREISLRVIAPQDQDIVRMHIAAEPKAVYPLQRFSVILSIAVKKLPAPYADENPVGVQTAPPELHIPWVEDKNLPEGLEPTMDWSRWLGPMESGRSEGFAINNISHESVFAFFERRRTTFMPPWKDIRLPDRSGTMADYREFQFIRTFVAKRVGQYAFGPVTLKGVFATGSEPVKGVLSGDIYAVAKQLLVNIKDVPEEGRPENYIGAIGQFDFEANLEPKKAKTGDPMTLTLTIDGQGTLDSAVAPDLTKIPRIAEKFKIYEATSETKGKRRQFTYSLRPLQAGLREFPSIKIAYFDPKAEKFVTLASSPIPIEIEKADKLAARDIIGAQNSRSSSNNDLEMRREGIFANITDLGQLSDESIRPMRWLAGLASLLGIYVALVFSVSRIRRLSSDTARQRRRAAPGNARRLLSQAMQDFSAGAVREATDRLESALVGLVADYTNLSAAGMTAAEACRQMKSLGVDAHTLDRVTRFMEQCESIHYGAVTSQAGEALRSEAKGVIEAAIGALKRSRR